MNDMLSLGHVTLAWEASERLLREAGIAAVVDIWIGPGSRRNPHFNRAALEHSLPRTGISYR